MIMTAKTDQELQLEAWIPIHFSHMDDKDPSLWALTATSQDLH